MFSITWNPNTIRSFQLSFPTVTVPIEEIRGIVEANFIHWSDGKHSGFNKINAIKELRGHFQLQTNKYYVMYGNTNLKIGLREAKEMIAATILDKNRERLVMGNCGPVVHDIRLTPADQIWNCG